MTRIIAADIGGTNANFAVIDGDNLKTTKCAEYNTRSWPSFIDMVKDYLTSIDEGIDRAGFAVAGPVENKTVTLTNADLTIDATEVEQNTMLNDVMIINDFTAISYVVNVVKDTESTLLKEGQPEHHGSKAILGPGTGLGMSILHYDEHNDHYEPIRSEGGHADLAYSESQTQLVNDIRGIVDRDQLRYEDVVSGPGLEHIYEALSDNYDVPDRLNAEAISSSRHSNPCSRATFNHFTTFLARAARSLALTAYATGGVYIAGGVAMQNKDMLDDVATIFTEHPTHDDILADIPLILLDDYSLTLTGVSYAMSIQQGI